MSLGWRSKNRAVFSSLGNDQNITEAAEPEDGADGNLSVPREDPWDAFVPDDDHEPMPEPGDFWCEDES